MSGNTSNTGKKAMLPVQGWAVVIITAAVIFGILGTVKLPNSHPFQHPQEQNYLNFEQRLNNLEDQINRDTTAYRVISFGSSLLASAYEKDSALNARFEHAGRPIRVYRAFYPGSIYKFLENPRLINFLEKARPDLLCIEDQAFLYDDTREDLVWPRPWLSSLHHTYVHNLNTLKHLLLPAYFPEPGFDGQIDPTLTFDQDQAELDSIITARDSMNYPYAERTIRPRSATKRFNRMLRSLSENGTQIAIVNIPRPAPIETRYLSEHSIRQREKLIQQYQRSVDLVYWPFPRPLPFRYYWDLSHMNGEGRKHFSDWLFEHIKDQYDRTR